MKILTNKSLLSSLCLNPESFRDSLAKRGEGRFFKCVNLLATLLVNMTVVAGFLSFSLISHASEKDAFVFKKQPELQQIKPKKPVKIKLRRSPKDEYTWELAGDDADEIVKTDRRLRKMLNLP